MLNLYQSTDYIRLFYGNYERYNNLNQIKRFAALNHLARQQRYFQERVDKKISATSGSPKMQAIFNTLLKESAGEEVFQQAIRQGLDYAKESNKFTTGRKVWKGGPSFYSMTPKQILDNWDEYTEGIEQLIEDMYYVLAKNVPGIGAATLQKFIKGEQLPASVKKRIINNLTAANNKIISTSQADIEKLVAELQKLEKVLTDLNKFSKSKTIDTASNIKGIVSSALGIVGGDLEEFAMAHGLQVSLGKMYKKLDSVLVEQTGSTLRPHLRGSLYEQWRKDNKIDDIDKEGVQQKSDNVITFSDNRVTASLGISIKRASWTTLNKYKGVALISGTSFLALIDRSLGFGTSSFDALLNIAAASTKDSVGNRSSNFKYSEARVNKLWQNVKRGIIFDNLLFAMGGSGLENIGNKNNNDNAFFLVINRKAYRLDTLLRMIQQSPGRVTVGVNKSHNKPIDSVLPRSLMTMTNELNYADGAGNPESLAEERSDKTRAQIIRMWQDQKIKISLSTI